MKFIPTPPENASSLIQHQYFWQKSEVGNDVYHLFQGIDRVASLWLNGKGENATVLELAKETLEFSDRSSFFKANLFLLGQKNGNYNGRIERNTANPMEGTIKLEEQIFGWKFHSRPDPCLLMMDQQRRRLFSYHYNPAYVRLILNKAGKGEEHLVTLLCIGLYLLPIWHNSHCSLVERNSTNGQENKIGQKLSHSGV